MYQPYPISIFIGGESARRVHWEMYKKDLIPWARTHGGVDRLTPVHTRFSRGWASLLSLEDDRTALLADPAGRPVVVDLCRSDQVSFPTLANPRGIWTVRKAAVRHRRLHTARVMIRYTELELVVGRTDEVGEDLPVIARSSDYLRHWQWGGQGVDEVRAYHETGGLRAYGEPGTSAGAWLSRVTLIALREQDEVPVIASGIGYPPDPDDMNTSE